MHGPREQSRRAMQVVQLGVHGPEDMAGALDRGLDGVSSGSRPWGDLSAPRGPALPVRAAL